MRPDITYGAVFPDYELSDHTGKHRKLSELQGPHPMILVLSRGGFCPKDRRQSELLVNSIARLRSPTLVSSPSAPTTLPRQVNIAPVWGRTGHFSPTRGARSKKTSTSLNTRIRSTIP